VAPSSNFPQLNIFRPSSGSNKELRSASLGIKAPMKLESLLGSPGCYSTTMPWWNLVYFEQVFLFHIRISEWVLPFLEQVLPFYAHSGP
jgi:hypothetical protein